MNKLLQRIITAVILLAFLLVVFFVLPEAAALVLMAAFVVAAAWEWAGFIPIRQTLLRVVYVLIVVFCMLAVSIGYFRAYPVIGLLWIGLGWWLLAFYLVLRFPIELSAAFTGACGFFVLIPVWVAASMLLMNSGAGPEMLLYVLAIVAAADIGAYFVGRRLGRVKLAPSVSPGKTWEGVGGGLFAALLVSLLGARLLDLPVAVLLPVGLSLALISILGDLTVSLFKRNAGLKDSGSLFPGHGGVLDRVDGSSAALPLFALLMDWFGLIVL